MAEVTALKGVVSSPLKQQFLDTIAQKFDKFVAEIGHEPDGMAFGFASGHGGSYVGWHVDNSFGAPSMIIARVGAGLLRSVEPDGDD